jgi:ABC-type transport system substrate-binding protein
LIPTSVLAVKNHASSLTKIRRRGSGREALAFGTGPKTFGDVYVDFNLVNSDPSSFPPYLLGSWNIKAGEWNLANYGAPAVDTLINEGLSAQNPAQRLATYGKMLKILAADEPYVPLYVQDYNLALSIKYKTTAGFSIAYSRLFPWELDVAPRS